MTETQTLLGSEPNGESQTQPRLLPELSGINFDTLKKSITFRDILKLGDAFLEGGNAFSEFMKEICPYLKKSESMRLQGMLKLKENFLLQLGNEIMNERDLGDLIDILENDVSVSPVVDQLKQYKNQLKIYQDLKQNPRVILEFVNGKYVLTDVSIISPSVPCRRIDTRIKFLFHEKQINETDKTIFNQFQNYLMESIPNIEFLDLSNNGTNLDGFFNQATPTPIFVLYDQDLYSQMRKYRGNTLKLEDRVSTFINLFLKIYMEFLTDKTNKRFYLFSFDDFNQNGEFVYKWLLRVPNEKPFLIKKDAEDSLQVRIKQYLSSHFYDLGGI